MKRIHLVLTSRIDRDWFAFAERLDVSHTSAGATVIDGLLRDDAAFYGLLDQARSMGVEIRALQYAGEQRGGNEE